MRKGVSGESDINNEIANSKNMNIAVLASGNGTNFEAIVNAVRRGYIKSNVKVLVVDKKDAHARVRAKRLSVPDVFIDPKAYKNRGDFDKALIKILKKEKINLVVLAGFMRILGRFFVRCYRNKIINIHPALLPSFKGVNAIRRALDYGCKVTGVTVHIVDDETDHGPIVLQEALTIKDGDSEASIEKKIHDIEHNIYSRAVKLFVEGRIRVAGRKVFISSGRIYKRGGR